MQVIGVRYLGRTKITKKQAQINRRRVAAQAAKTKVSLSARLGLPVDPRIVELAKEARL